MHDPKSVAFEIKNPFFKKDKYGYKPSVITIWHNDPCTDSTDDSCGSFIRERHVPKKIIEDVVKEFESEWDITFKGEGENGFIYNRGWFNPEGENIVSVRGIVLNMYIYAAKIALNPDGKIGPGKMWDKAFKFINDNYAQIMYFAENNRDSMRDNIVRTFQIGCNVAYTKSKRQEMIHECASIIVCDILRRTRPWYKHPRWHIKHWSFQVHPIQNLKRRYWDKCCKCGKREFKESAMSDWYGTSLWHQKCDGSLNAKVIPETNLEQNG